MNDLLEGLSVAIPVCMIFGLFLGTAAFFRYLRFKETVALAEKGLVRQSENRGRKAGTAQVWGGILFAIGMALFLGLLTEGFGPWLIAGMLPMFLGIALYVIGYADRDEDVEMPANIDDAQLNRKMNQD
jgi:hypothetical protein